MGPTAAERWDAAWTVARAPDDDAVWLDGHLPAPGDALDLGAGIGGDTHRLVAEGFAVTACDASGVALERLAVSVPAVRCVRHELPAPLPFADAVFDVVVAGLSLHYFPRAETHAIVAEIRRVLRPGGRLVARVNADDDGSFQLPPGAIEVEPGVLVHPIAGCKRYFSDTALREAVAPHLEVLTTTHEVDPRYGSAKATRVVVAVRS